MSIKFLFLIYIYNNNNNNKVTIGSLFIWLPPFWSLICIETARVVFWIAIRGIIVTLILNYLINFN